MMAGHTGAAKETSDGVAAMQTTSPIPEAFAKDAIIAWFRGEFAAANAIIDVLCNHLTQLDGKGGSDYESVFAAIHRRRLNWIPVLHMQKYFSIADVAIELGKVKAQRSQEQESGVVVLEDTQQLVLDSVPDGSSDPKILQQDLNVLEQSNSKINVICSNHDECELRRATIKMTKGFIAREPVKGQMVNVVKGLKLYEDIFTETELSKLADYINELRTAGHKGALSGETFILFNQQLKGNKRELIQLGVPVFGQIKEEGKYNIEPIPPVLQAVIDHLVQWHLLPESRKPDSCIINFFDEGEYSQPYLKPPHLDQPISTLVLSESSMGFGRILASDHSGNFKGTLMLTVKEGSLLVMRGNSADMAKHVICASPSKRVCLTFCKVRPFKKQVQSPITSPLTTTMTVWQPGPPRPCKMPNGAFNGFDPIKLAPKWGLIHSPLVMLAHMRPMVVNPKRFLHGGTGVFLPWKVGPKKHVKHLPPRAQKNKFIALHSPTKTQMVEPCPDLSA